MTGPVDHRPRDAEALLAAMRALARRTMPEWTTADDEADFGTVLLEAFAHVGDILNYYVDAVAAESFLSTAQSRRSVVEHLRLIGYELATATPARAELRLGLDGPLSEMLTISSGAAFTTQSRPGSPSVRFEYLGVDDLVIPADTPSAGAHGPVPPVPVEEGRTVTDEVVGVSTGVPHQRFRLLHPDVLLRPSGTSERTVPDLLVTSEIPGQPGTQTRWTRAETLVFTGPDPHVVACEIDADGRAEVVFGSTVPPAEGVVRATYRVGGGERGDVAAGTITQAEDPAFARLGVAVTNPLPARGGAGPESTEHAVAHGPQHFRTLGRAVTAGDYQTLAAQVGGVGKVRAQAADDRTVTLHVAQVGGVPLADDVRADVLAYLEDRRLVGTRVEVSDVVSVPVFVALDVVVEPRRPTAFLESQVRAAVQGLLAFERVDFEQTFYLSKVYEAVEAIDGVAGVVVTGFAAVPGPSPDETLRTGRLVPEPYQLFRLPEPDEPGPQGVLYPGGVRITTSEDPR